MVDLKSFKVVSLAVHQLPKREEGDDARILSDVESPLDARISRFFEDRVRKALDLAASPIEFLDVPESPVPAQVTDLLTSPTKDFIVPSQVIAKRLIEIRNRLHSEGLLCVIRCKLGALHGLAIIKLEHELGVRAGLQGADGARHFQIEIIDDLMLTNKTDVFKVALFTKPNGSDSFICDNQSAANAPAKYFLKDFLGCQRLANPDVLTQTFFQAAQKFIGTIQDGEKIARYATALVAEMNKTSSVISPKAFARGNLEPGDRSPLLEAIKAVNVPLASFQKDTALIKNSIQRIRFQFADVDVDVFVPPDRLKDETVKVSKGPKGKTKLRVEATLKKAKGGR
jgi:hypothetical protein